MNIFTENDYELELIEEITSIMGYEYKTQEEIINLRKDLKSVLLDSVLLDSIRRVNKDITEENANKVYQKVSNVISSSFIEANKSFQSFLTSGVKVRDDKLDKTITYKLIDDKDILNNTLIVTNQFIMSSRHPQYDNQKPDLVIYINGMPLIIFELKGLKEENTLDMAYKQMKNYQEFLPDLFAYNAFNIISNRQEIRFGSITASFLGINFEKVLTMKIPQML